MLDGALLMSWSRLLQTMPYMPPELLAQSQLTPKADVYSFGIVMWELLSGQVCQLCLTHSPCLLHSLMADTAGALMSWIEHMHMLGVLNM